MDKPAGWVVNDAKTAHDNPILQNWLRDNYTYEISKSIDERSGIVHRLDKETSGLLIVAKTSEVFRNLQEQFKTRKIGKEYLALVHGEVKDNKGHISAPVGRLPWNRERFGVIPSGKAAETDFSKGGIYKDRNGNLYTLLRLFPKTGRTHQIRIHLKYLNHPIVSDTFYAGRKTSKRDRLWCERLFLHAGKICFIHPDGNKRVCIESDIALDLKNALSTLVIQ